MDFSAPGSTLGRPWTCGAWATQAFKEWGSRRDRILRCVCRQDRTRKGSVTTITLRTELRRWRVTRTPNKPGLPSREQHRFGRYDLLGTTFETFERKIRDQLGRMLSAGGFDPAKDIEAITVNRWAHGYAYEYNSLWEPQWSEDQKPCVIGRQPFGSISIANSDAAAYPYIDPAIDQAYRAVQEVAERSD